MGYSAGILLLGESKESRSLKTPQLRNENPAAFIPSEPLMKSLGGNSQEKKKKRRKRTKKENK